MTRNEAHPITVEVVRNAIVAYAELEDRLSETPYFDPEWPMPYAKSQWMLWETLGRTATTAEHGALWDVMAPLIQDVDSGKI
jgi:predicted DNA-binding transcriptional regulator YafY